MKFIVHTFHLGSAAGLCVASILVDHAKVRTHPFFAEHPFWPPILALLLVIACVWTLIRYRTHGGARSLSRFAIAGLGLVFVPALSLACMVAVLNLKSAARTLNQESARISVDAATGVLRIQGSILPQTVADIARILQQPTPIHRVDINSLGGEITAAREIGRRLQERGLPVRIAGYCASACVDVWALAEQRQISPAAMVGLHQPHSGDMTQGGFLNRLALGAKRDESIKLLMAVGFPRDVVEDALNEPSRKISWFNTAQLVSLGVQVKVVNED